MLCALPKCHVNGVHDDIRTKIIPILLHDTVYLYLKWDINFRDSVAKPLVGLQTLDPEELSLALEFSLTVHFMQVK